jgi:lysophospholipase L1-like esterase
MSVVSGVDLSQADRPMVLAISLFTNDDPTHTSALETAVRRTLALVGSRGCAIWATIARPPVNGVSYRAANALLARIATDNARLRLVPWAERVAATPQLLGADGVHPTPAGYQLRAQLYAQAAQACA